MTTTAELKHQHQEMLNSHERTIWRLIQKVERHEGLLVRILAFGKTLQDMVDIQAGISDRVSGIADVLEEIHSWGGGELEATSASNRCDWDTDEGNKSPSGPVTLGPEEMPITEPGPVEETAGPVLETSSTDVALPTSPDIIMTTPTPLNSQDNPQETTTIVPTAGCDPPTPANSAPGITPPSNIDLAPVEPPPTNPVPELLPPPPSVRPAKDQLSPPLPVEDDATQKPRRSWTPNIGDRRSP